MILKALFLLPLYTSFVRHASSKIFPHTQTFSNGVEIPVLGLGTYLAKGKDVERAVDAALQAGYRAIDTAFVYENEKEVGNALKRYLANGNLSREDVFITTKLPPTHNRREDVEPMLRKQLELLQLDYVDLYLIHQPDAKTHDNKQDPDVRLEDIWKGMEDVYEKNLTRAIGVSNWNITQMERVINIAKVPIHNAQDEAHIHFRNTELQEFCKKNNITMTAYAPFGSPGRTNYQDEYPFPWPPGPKPLLNKYVLKLAGQYGRPASHILLRYLLQRGLITIPKSSNPERIMENINIFDDDFKLSEEEMKQLNQQEPQRRSYEQPHMIGHPEDAFVTEREQMKEFHQKDCEHAVEKFQRQCKKDE